MSKDIDDHPFSESECAPQYVIDWVKENFTVSPKDFKPKCHYMNEFVCWVRDEEGHAIDSVHRYMCVSCDIRKECVYKRE